MANDRFKHEFSFSSNQLVVMKHPKGKFLRIDPNDNDQLCENGGCGKWAHWHVELHGEEDGKQVVKIKHNATNKYLRIYEGGGKIDVGGGGGKWTRFKVHKTGNNSAKLESCELNGKYPAVQPKGCGIGGGGKWTEFHFFTDEESVGGAGNFKNAYQFKGNQKVVLRHPKGKFLRIDPNDNNELCENGGTGKWAQWHVELHGEQDGKQVVKIKHNETNKYLRIYEDGNRIDVGGGGGKWTRFKVHMTGNNSAKLESCELDGKFPAVQPKGPGIGGGGKWTEFHFFSDGAGGGGGGAVGAGDFDKEYHFHHPKMVVLRHPKGKFLRIDPNANDQLCENGGTGKWARWHIELHGEKDGKPVVKVKHDATGKYLRIYDGGNTIDVGGGGGKWTLFKVHKTSNNSAKLESCELDGKYPAVQPKGCAIGGGGKWTEFHFFRKD